MSPPINIDGSSVTDITIDGTTVSEVTVDGQTVFAPNATPDAVVTQYQYEDEADTAVAIDSIGSLDADITDGTYITDSADGDHALSLNGSSAYIESQSSIDLAAQGSSDGFGLGGFVRPDRDTATEVVHTYRSGSGTYAQIIHINGEFSVSLNINSGGNVQTSSVASTIGSYQHVWANFDQSDLWLLVDGSEVSRTSHSFDLTNFGSAVTRVGVDSPSSGNYWQGDPDNSSLSDAALSESEVQQLI